MKKRQIFAVFLVLGIIFSTIPAFAAAKTEYRTYRDNSLKVKIKIPKKWKVTKDGANRYFKGRKIIMFSLQQVALDKDSTDFWQKSKMGFLDSFSRGYAEGSQDSLPLTVLKLYKFQVKNYNSGAIVYKGKKSGKPIKVNQVLVLRGALLYVLSGFAYKKEYIFANNEYFVPVFKSFRTF